MAVVKEDLSVFVFMQTPVINGWLFYSVLNHANYNATGGGLEFDLQTYHSISQVSTIYLHLLLSLLPVNRIGANIANDLAKKRTVWLSFFVCRHLAFSVVGIITYLLM